MNIFGAIILAALLAEYLLNLVSDILNMGTLGSDVPAEFSGLYGGTAYSKSHAYTAARTFFGICESSVNLAAVLIFWFSGGFNHLDQMVRGMHLGSIASGMIYAGALMLIRFIISLPFQIYSTFVIEERFGFNRTAPGTFAADIFKGMLIAILLGGGLLLGVLELFEHAGSLAWLYCWATSAVFILLIQFVAPAWILPLFNKFTPLAEGELKKAILSYAGEVKFSLRDVYVMDGSKRSSKSNAFFTGYGKNKRIALFDTLIQKHTTAELVAVLAHEIGHYKKKHVLQSIIISILHMGAMFLLLSFFIGRPELFDAFYMKNVSVYAGLVFFGMLVVPFEFAVSLLLNAISRKNEYDADRFAVQTTGKRDAMIDALKKLSVDNLSHLTPHPFYVSLNYSHPPVLERIKAIRSGI